MGDDTSTSTSTTTIARIREDDILIDLDETRRIMGNISLSTAYADPELMALKINMTAPGPRGHLVRLIHREVHALRAERVARAAANAEIVRAETLARVEQRRARQRLRYRASAAE